MFGRKKISRYIFSVIFIIIFSLLIFTPATAEEGIHSTSNEAVHSVSNESGHEGGHGGDKSADLQDLLYRFINFALLVIILFFVIKKSPIKGFFKARSNEIQQRLEDLKREKEEAENRYLEIEKQLKDFEAKRKEIIDQFREEGLAEKEKIITEAKDRVKQIIEQSELAIQHEIQAAKDRLKLEVVDQAVQKAQEIIAEEMDEKAQDNLVNEFIERVGKIH